MMNAACKFVKPVLGLMTITTTNEASKYYNPCYFK